MRAIWGTVHGFRKSFKTNKNSKEELELSGSEGVCMYVEDKLPGLKY